MKTIVICGAGEVGTVAAEVLADTGADITVIDRDPAKLTRIEDTMDVATINGDAADASALIKAGVDGCDLLLAATDVDEVNMLCGTLGKRLGAAKTVVRVHKGTYYDLGSDGFDYAANLAVDRLVCPEHAAAMAIARDLRNPGAVAIELFGRGRLEMQEFIADAGSALGRPLSEIRFPAGSRLTMIRRRGSDDAEVPTAATVVEPGDTVILVGNADVFDAARKLFRRERMEKRRLVIMGGPPMAEWLCRALKGRRFAIRLFETDRARAEELAETLDWVTVLHADPTDRVVFDEENLVSSDAFVSLLGGDEASVIAAILAARRGIDAAFAVVRQDKFHEVALDTGVRYAYSTRQVAGEEIRRLLDTGDILRLGSLAADRVDVRQVRIRPGSAMAGRLVRDLALSPDWVIAALSRHDEIFVPGADDRIMQGDVLLVCGRTGAEAEDHLESAVAVTPRGIS